MKAVVPAPNLNFIAGNNDYSASDANANNTNADSDNGKSSSNSKRQFDPPMSSLDVLMDVPDIFGSLDFFDYDLLFQND